MDKWLKTFKNKPTYSESQAQFIDINENLQSNIAPTCSEKQKYGSETQDVSDNLFSDVQENKLKWSQKNNHNKEKYKFSHKWLDNEEYKGWLSQSQKKRNKSNVEFAFCKVCNYDILAHKSCIRRHMLSRRHKFNWQQVDNNKKVTDTYKTTALETYVKTAEIKLCGLLATNNLPFCLMDTLSPLLKNIFPDSEIAKLISLNSEKD